MHLVINKKSKDYQLEVINSNDLENKNELILPLPKVRDHRKVMSYKCWCDKYDEYVEQMANYLMNKITESIDEHYTISWRANDFYTWLSKYVYQTSLNKYKSYYFLK